ncbi:MAG TPA: hypothetical protein PLM93_05920 [Sulfuricurvum sp.]|nr:MAG: hypothetical protein B7Y30_07940 [Campylobacterales bacterium 16-40-21]OZA02751.1 MAG: hypothetical protein B7X89_08180 [Sulfuricurvum sp. 17-40-25]HQS66706.1 hypothetical protein [Sulfuricurvum sp.]HQT37337.1 hypothetical protein [Sulfuricurvum sp.]
MNKLLMILASVALMVSVAQADVKKGQRAYLKTFKSAFGMNGTKFAAEHTVHEWEGLFADGAKGFIKEYGERFPKAKKKLENPHNAGKLQDIGDFVKEYGNDSGNVPSCG